MSAYCAAVDWGTSSFRLWLLDRDGAVLDHRHSRQGLFSCAPGSFASILTEHLDAIGASRALPAVVCGMAGSRQGWHEAPYQTVPVPMSHILQGAVKVPGIERDVWILPGIAQRDSLHADVMRGEETQLYGALGEQMQPVTACMPGTHSKWVVLRDGAVNGFTTYMSGDLYAAISEHTILAQSGPSPDGDEAAFAAAVRQALDAPGTLTAALFGLRGRQLLGYLPGEAVAPSISGLLIGTEIACAIEAGVTEGDVALIASGVLAHQYAAALAEAGLSYRLIDAEAAVVEGLFRAVQGLLDHRTAE